MSTFLIWQARSLAAGFDAAREAAAAHWEGRWSAAFAAGNGQYSGHLPSLEGDADVGRTYYLSALSLLSMERRVQHKGVAWDQAYTTGGPRTGVTTDYCTTTAQRTRDLHAPQPCPHLAARCR